MEERKSDEICKSETVSEYEEFVTVEKDCQRKEAREVRGGR